MNEDEDKESQIAERWLNWCRNHSLVKCIEWKVPAGILPPNYSGTLIDVKVHGKKAGPDDKIYSMHEDLRQKVARGNCVLELKNNSSEKPQTKYYFMVFALRKFSGGMGDEDDSMCQNMWENYFIKPVDNAERVVVTQKANGEAAHVSSRKIAGCDLFCIGSKNVHILVKNSNEIDTYMDGRFTIARKASQAFFYKFEKFSNEKQLEVIEFLQGTKSTGVFELLQPESQHIENLDYLEFSELVFICWSEMYNEGLVSLCFKPPNEAIDQAASFGFTTVKYEVIPVSQAEEMMGKIRREFGYEGKVLYYINTNNKVIGILKKKTAWYIILRSIREKLCHFSSPKSSQTKLEIKQKMTKRLIEIQNWLGLSDECLKTWKKLAHEFIYWTLEKRFDTKRIRNMFPQLWSQFLECNEEAQKSYDLLMGC